MISARHKQHQLLADATPQRRYRSPSRQEYLEPASPECAPHRPVHRAAVRAIEGRRKRCHVAEREVHPAREFVIPTVKQALCF